MGGNHHLVQSQLKTTVLHSYAHVQRQAPSARVLWCSVWIFRQWNTPVLKYLTQCSQIVAARKMAVSKAPFERKSIEFEHDAIKIQ